MSCRFLTVLSLFLVWSPMLSHAQDGLPLPAPQIPDEPRLPPMVITSGGQRLLLEQSGVEVRYNAQTKSLESSQPGWWLINFPLRQIVGLEELGDDEIAQRLFGRPHDDLQNWYLRTPGKSPEPAVATGPGAITAHPHPDLVVNQRHPEARDQNDGTVDAPLRSIAAAVERAAPGHVIHVYPGIYRESVKNEIPGTRDKPIYLEGIRDQSGSLPTISGNDAAPKNAWTRVDGSPDVWRADNWVGRPADLAMDGRVLRERTVVSELGDYEFCLNHADRELCFPRLSPAGLSSDVVDLAKDLTATGLLTGSTTHEAINGGTALGSTWQRKGTDAEGMLDLGDDRGVSYLSSWVWLEPGRKNEVWSPNHPEPVTGELFVKGRFRASRQGGSSYGSQLNLYRLWINGQLMPAAGKVEQPKARTGYGQDGDSWMRIPMQEGWNHVMVLLDSRHKTSDAYQFRFGMPKGAGDGITSATEPSDKSKATDTAPAAFITEWMVLSHVKPQSLDPEQAIYLRVPEGKNPNELLVDMGRRQLALSVEAPWWTVRGLEFVNGSQYQQQPLVQVKSFGVTIEHCLFRETEVRMLSMVLSAWDQTDPMSVVRGNYFLSPGSLGIGCSGNTKKLTPENQSTTAPGRGRMLVENNLVYNNNRNGFKRLWESGAMKFFRCTGCVIRNNTIVGGDGPGIWLDWEHYSNRVEGNYIRDVPACGVGVEASPGPMLIANNVTEDIRGGGAWFKYGILAWSSARIWAVSNTVSTPNGAMFAEGNSNRSTAWQELPERNAAVVNNLFVCDSETMHKGRVGYVEGNRLYGGTRFQKSGLNQYSRWGNKEFGERVEASDQMGGRSGWPEFKQRQVGNYRYPRSHSAASAGVEKLEVTTAGHKIDVVSFVKRDFYGLLRFPQDGVPAGAFRLERQPSDADSAQIEIEWADGSIERRWTPR